MSSRTRVHSAARVETREGVRRQWPLGDDKEYDIEVLSDDPRVYLIHDLISEERCRDLIAYASSLGSDSAEGDCDDEYDERRTMTRSNPPELFLVAGRLWPLPFLCLGAGIPPVLRLFESLPVGSASPSLGTIATAGLPPVAAAAALTAALALFITEALRGRSESTSRTSEAVSLNSEADVGTVRDLVERASGATGGHPPASFEAPVVTRYPPGGVFEAHNDASPTRGSEWSDLGGQRVATVITYLNTCELGGGTRFDRLGFTVQPRLGSALVFYPAHDESLDADERTRYESLPAVEEKWIVQMFVRAGKRVPPPLGLPNSFFA